jgi:hypothetical protein
MTQVLQQLELCPVCQRSFPISMIEAHINECLDNVTAQTVSASSPSQRQPPSQLQAVLEEQRRREELENERLLAELLAREREEVERQREQENSAECVLCEKRLSLEKFWFLSECEHYFCHECLRAYVLRKVEERKCSEIACVTCHRALAQGDLKALLTPQEFERYLTTSVEEVTASPQYTRCPNPQCQLIVERVQTSGEGRRGSDQQRTKTEREKGLDGPPLSEEAIAHRNEFRFRCRQCQTEYCAQCRVTPYHLGFTCEKWKTYLNAQHCRYCNVQLTNTNRARNYELLCINPECQTKAQYGCHRRLSCGHLCNGIANETHCPPCLICNETADEFCAICYVEGLRQAPYIRLECGHDFHYECVRQKIVKRWSGAVVSFAFLECPRCRRRIAHPALQKELGPVLALYQDIEAKALTRLKYMNLDNAKEIKEPGQPFFNNPTGFALHKFCYYICYKCQKPYFGGERACNAEQRVGDFDPTELVCGGCSNSGNSDFCPKHGKEYIEYKCRFCCNVACWFCWGTTHFCDQCHQKATKISRKPKHELPKCNCNVKHPPNGEEFCLGCTLCRLQSDF